MKVHVQVLEQEGFQALEGTYRRYWLHEQQQLQLRDEEAGNVRNVCLSWIQLWLAQLWRAQFAC